MKNAHAQNRSLRFFGVFCVGLDAHHDVCIDRIIAVRLLQPLVFESIQFSLTLFSSGGKMGREAEQSAAELEELEECRKVLQATLDQHGGNPWQ
jgi:hypothetical protein